MAGPLSISKAIEKNKNDLLRMGYTVDYTGILSHLYNPTKKKTKKLSTNSSDSALSTMTYSEYYATLLGTADTLGTIVNGYVQEVELQQAVCIVKPFLSFPAKAKDDKVYNIPIEVPDDSQINGGATLSGAGTTIPTKVDENYLNAFKGAGNNFLIGVGLDLDNFVPNYLRHFYGSENSDWTALEETVIPNLKSLAEKKLLFAEITFNIGGTGKILNAPIIMSNGGSTPHQDASTLHHLWIPCPLIQLNEYKALGEVVFEHAGKNATVHTDGYSYPFASAGYEHKKGSIRGLTADYYKSNVISHKPSFLPYKGIKWNAADVIEDLPSKDVLARTRIYFSEDGKTEIEALIGEVPESCKRIYGPLKTIETKKLTDTTSLLHYGGDEIYFEEGKYPNLTKEIFYKAIRICWCYEVGSSRAVPDKLNYVQDEEWPSYGSYQIIERYDNENISKVLKEYVSICGEGNYNSQLVNEAMLVHGYKTGNIPHGEDKKNMDRALRELGKDKRMMTAQSMFHWKNFIPSAMNFYNSFKFNSVFGIYASIDVYNHGGANTMKKKYRDYIANSPDEATRVKRYIEKRKEYLKSLRFKEGHEKAGELKWNYYGGWRNKMADWERNMKDGDFNMTTPKKWNGVTM